MFGTRGVHYGLRRSPVPVLGECPLVVRLTVALRLQAHRCRRAVWQRAAEAATDSRSGAIYCVSARRRRRFAPKSRACVRKVCVTVFSRHRGAYGLGVYEAKPVILESMGPRARAVRPHGIDT